MIKKKMITIIAGVAVGLVVVGGTVGGLAGAGLLSTANNDTTPTHINDNKKQEVAKESITALKSLTYKEFSEELGQTVNTSELSEFAQLSNEEQDKKLDKLKTELKNNNKEDKANRLDRIIQNLKDKKFDSIKNDLTEMWIKYGQNIEAVKELGTKALEGIKTFMGSALPGKDGNILKSLNKEKLRWFYNDLWDGLADKTNIKPIEELLSSTITTDNILDEIEKIKKKIGDTVFMKYKAIAKKIAMGDKEKINEISNKYKNVVAKIQKINIYKVFLQYAKDKTGISSVEDLKTKTASAIDEEINKLKDKLDIFHKQNFDKVYAEVKDKLTLTDAEFAKIQEKLVQYTNDYKANLFTKSRWLIYTIFSKAHLKEGYTVKNEKEFKDLGGDRQYSELIDLRTAISQNGKNYSTMVVKALNKAIDTIKKIEEATDLSSEQQKLVQDAIGSTARDLLAKVIAKQVREEVYSTLELRSYTNGLASLDQFKGFNRDNQFKELKKVKDKIGKDESDIVKNAKRLAYENAINLYETKEQEVFRGMTSSTLKAFLGGISSFVTWLNKKSIDYDLVLKKKAEIFKTFYKYAKDKTDIARPDQIERFSSQEIQRQVDALKGKLTGFDKIHFENIYNEVKDATTLTNEELERIQNKLVETTNQFKAKLFTKSRWQIYEIFSKADLKEGYTVKNEKEFKDLGDDSQYSELIELKTAISQNGKKYSGIAVKALDKAIDTIKKIEIATNLSPEQQKLIQDTIALKTRDLLAKVIAKQVRQQVYKLLISKGLADNHMANYDAFKRLSRDLQFAEMKKAKSNIRGSNSIKTLALQTAYWAAISGYKAEEKKVSEALTGAALRTFLAVTEKAVRWLQEYRASS